MIFNIKGIKIYIEETVIVTLILMVLFSYINQYLSSYIMCYLFIIFHELAHIVIASIFKVNTNKIEIRTLGLCAKLDDYERKGLKWVCIFLAGPIANILLAIMFRNNIMIMSINIAMAVINLVPIYPLDGYNILKILLQAMKLKNTRKTQHGIEKIILIILVIIGAIQLVKYSNPSIVLLVIYAYIQSKTAEEMGFEIMYQKYYKNITNF